MSYSASVHAKAAELTKLAVEMTTAAGSGHPTSAASLAHLVTVLMYGHMRYDPTNPTDAAADRLVLSEGHACPIVYAAGADLGLPVRGTSGWRPMTRDDAMRLREIDSPIDGHPNPAAGFPFFPAATGSLGQGLSLSSGIALAARLDGIDKRVFCLIGDGESREGQVWEAVDFILDHRLVEVCPIFNCNGFGQSDPVSAQQSAETLAAKLQGAGIDCLTVDGHDPEEIRNALLRHAERAARLEACPLAIVATTKKGWGFSTVLGSEVHGKPVAEDDLPAALQAVDETARNLNAAWTKGDLILEEPRPVARPASKKAAEAPAFGEAVKRFGYDDLLKSGKLATRKAYGIALRVLGHVNPHVVALDGDVRNSTYSEYFADDPLLRQRFFKCRIAEQNMISVAAGLAAEGKIPFASSFGKFIMRGYDQLEMALISRLNVKVTGSHVGVSLAADGPSQMALPDVGYFRAWTTVRRDDDQPVLYLLNPSDARCAYSLTLAMAEHEGACYLRTMRPDVPLIYGVGTKFHLGGHEVLTFGQDLLIVASGYMVHEALKAVELLHRQDIRPTLVDAYSLPFDESAMATLAEANGGQVLSVEDNYGGGIGSAVADALTATAGNFAVRQLYVRRIPKSGRTPDDVLEFLGLAAHDIASAAQEMLVPRP